MAGYLLPILPAVDLVPLDMCRLALVGLRAPNFAVALDGYQGTPAPLPASTAVVGPDLQGFAGDGYTNHLNGYLLGALPEASEVPDPCRRTRGPLLPNTAMDDPYIGVGPLPYAGTEWFGRVWLLASGVPVTGFAFGNIVSEVNVLVTVWNAHPVQRTMLLLDFDPAEGAFLIGPEPRVFAAMETFDYTLRVPIEGPPVVDTSVEFDFDTPESPSLTVTANIAIALAFPPNWESRVQEVLEWFTDVLTSFNGTEQRIKLREFPRRSWQYEVLLQDHQSKQLEALTWSRQHLAFAVPIWPDCERTSDFLPQGTASINIAQGTDGTDWKNNGIGFLVAGDDGVDAYATGNTPAEVLQVSTVLPGSIQLSNPTSRDWPIGTLVAPAKFMRMRNSLRMERITDTVLRAQLDLQEVDPDTTQDVPTGVVTYDGDPVFPFQENRRESGEDTYERAWDRLDPQVGIWTIDPRSNRPTIKRSRRFLLEGGAEIRDMREWLYSMYGRLLTVWLPSDESDLDHVGPVGGSTLTIRAFNYAAFYGTHEYHRDLVVTDTRDDSKFYTRVTAAVAAGAGQEALTILPTFTAIPEAFARVQVLQRSRLEADRVTLRFETDSVVEVTMFFRSL